jgi:hypothetical protein
MVMVMDYESWPRILLSAVQRVHFSKALEDVDINRRVFLWTGGAFHIRDGRISGVALLGGYSRL